MEALKDNQIVLVSGDKGVLFLGVDQNPESTPSQCPRNRLQPTAVEALKDKRIVLISGGWRHTAAADDGGNLYTWGWNKAGRPPLLHTPINCQARVAAAARLCASCCAAVLVVTAEGLQQFGS